MPSNRREEIRNTENAVRTLADTSLHIIRIVRHQFLDAHHHNPRFLSKIIRKFNVRSSSTI